MFVKKDINKGSTISRPIITLNFLFVQWFTVLFSKSPSTSMSCTPKSNAKEQKKDCSMRRWGWLPRRSVDTPSQEVLKADQRGLCAAWSDSRQPTAEVEIGWALRLLPTQPLCESTIGLVYIAISNVFLNTASPLLINLLQNPRANNK